MMESEHSHKIAIVAYPGVQMSAVLGLSDLFLIASRIGAQYGGRGLGAVQVSEETVANLAAARFDAVILPPSLQRQRGRNKQEIHNWLRLQHGAGAVMCSVCAGAFWLGHSGLLKGRPVTTHWMLETEFRDAFPDTELDTGQLLIDDNDIVTAGGLMAWLDLGLFLVNRWMGAQVVSETARQLLVDPGGREQKTYRSFRPPRSHGDSKILELQHWLEGEMDQPIPVKYMAARLHLSERTFLRRFKKATGFTPNAYLQNLRVEKARGLLERTYMSAGEISFRVGYQDPSAFSRIFLNITGITVREYRNRFCVPQGRSGRFVR